MTRLSSHPKQIAKTIAALPAKPSHSRMNILDILVKNIQTMCQQEEKEKRKKRKKRLSSSIQ